MKQNFQHHHLVVENGQCTRVWGMHFRGQSIHQNKQTALHLSAAGALHSPDSWRFLPKAEAIPLPHILMWKSRENYYIIFSRVFCEWVMEKYCTFSETVHQPSNRIHNNIAPMKQSQKSFIMCLTNWHMCSYLSTVIL